MIQEKILILFFSSYVIVMLLCSYIKCNFPSFLLCYLQIDGHDSGTESDGDLDTEDFNERDIELSEYYGIVDIFVVDV